MTTTRTKTFLSRLGLTLAALVVVFGALVGVAHTSFGRPILAWLGGVGVSGGCPLGFDQVDPAAAESFRQEQLAGSDGTVAATTTKALDFELGKTTRADLTRWMVGHRATCRADRQGSVWRCSSFAITPAAAPTTSDLFLQLDPHDRLVAVDLLRPPTCARDAAATLRASSAALAIQVGPATATRGEADGAWLGAEPMRSATLEFRYLGFVATVSATNLGARGVRVREQYQWSEQQGPRSGAD